MFSPEDKVNAFRNFEKKLKRYTESTDESIEIKSQDHLIKQVIKESAVTYKDKVIRIYQEYIEPQSIQTEQDQDALVKAYDMYKAMLDLNDRMGDTTTRVSSFTISSILARNQLYTVNDKFVYLQMWFMNEKGYNDYVPVMVQTKNGYRLDFVDPDDFAFTGNNRRIASIINEYYYN